MYRALEAHMILYLTLYKNYVQNLVESNIVVEIDLRETITAFITNFQNYGIQKKGKLQRNKRDVLEVFKTTDLHSMQKEFYDQMKFQARFYCNFVPMFETLLLFIPSRDKDVVRRINVVSTLSSDVGMTSRYSRNGNIDTTSKHDVVPTSHCDVEATLYASEDASH